MLDVTEQVVNLVPLRVRRRVKWGECDPAGVVYTARFSDYVISAFELFMRHLVDEPGCDTPAKALSFEFLASLRPGDEFEMTVQVADIRNRTFDLDILARDLDGKNLFRARLTPITIKRGDRSRAIELPAMLRERLESYRNSCGKEGAFTSKPASSHRPADAASQPDARPSRKARDPQR